MKIFDKAQWHIDAGMEEKSVIKKFKEIFDFLNENKMLSADGKEMIEVGIDSSISLNENMVNDRGKQFLSLNYDSVINIDDKNIKKELENKYKK